MTPIFIVYLENFVKDFLSGRKWNIKMKISLKVSDFNGLLTR